MPAPIDLLYRLTRRDRAFPNWGPTAGFLDHTEVTGGPFGSNVVDWDASNRPPDGTVLFITNLLIIARPAVTETTISIACQIRNRNTDAVLATLLNAAVAPVAFPKDLTVHSNVDIPVLLDRNYLTVQANFSLGANSRVFMNWAGYIMPQGEIGFN